MSTDVLYATGDGVATITIDRPEVLNAFRERTMVELIDAFDRADDDRGVGVIVLTGTGDAAFSTGGDVDMEDGFDADVGRRTARILIRLAEAVRGTNKPTIAKIRGWCVGGGNELNIMCDLALPSVRQGFAALTGFYETEEFHEGTRAFLERRPPRFREPGTGERS